MVVMTTNDMTSEELLRRLALTDAPAEVQQSVVADVVQTVETRFAAAVEDLMTTEQAAAFAQLSPDDPSAAHAWLQQHIPGTDKLYLAIFNDYMTELMHRLSSASPAEAASAGGR